MKKKSEVKRHLARTNQVFPHYWMCEHCAFLKGGEFPGGHTCTATYGECEYCKERGHPKKQQILVPWVDFNWPKDKAADRAAKTGRD
jgi:hypothetical protein